MAPVVNASVTGKLLSEATALAPDNGGAWAFLGLTEYERADFAHATMHILKAEALGLPEDLDYRALKGLSNEVRHKLALLRPRTIGQAARIDGITPAAVMLLLAHIRRKQPTSAAPARPSSAR